MIFFHAAATNFSVLLRIYLTDHHKVEQKKNFRDIFIPDFFCWKAWHTCVLNPFTPMTRYDIQHSQLSADVTYLLNRVHLCVINSQYKSSSSVKASEVCSRTLLNQRFEDQGTAESSRCNRFLVKFMVRVWCSVRQNISQSSVQSSKCGKTVWQNCNSNYDYPSNDEWLRGPYTITKSLF